MGNKLSGHGFPRLSASFLPPHTERYSVLSGWYSEKERTFVQTFHNVVVALPDILKTLAEVENVG
jgi:hypothetical protein